MIKSTSLICLFLVSTLLAIGQSADQFQLDLNWEGSLETLEIPVGQLGFEAAEFKGEIPFWNQIIPTTQNYSNANCQLEDIEVENVSSNSLTEQQKRTCPTSFEVEARTSSEGRDHFFLVSGSGLRNNNGVYEKLVSAKVVVTGNFSSNGRDIEWEDNSVLAEGEWYKIGIAEDGVYRISRSFLQSLGVDVNTVNPQNINIYGNGGEMLPFDNQEFRYTDLQRNSIFVQGEGDGSFDSNDFILFYGKGSTSWDYVPAESKFEHQKHHYSDSAYYFIRVDDVAPQRIMEQTSSGSSDYDVSVFDDYDFIEDDETNFIKSGRRFFGQKFDIDPLTIPFNFSFANLVPETATIDVSVVGRSLGEDSEFVLSAYGESLNMEISETSTSVIANVANAALGELEVVPTGNNVISLSLTYNKGVPNAEGWLDWLRVNCKRELNHVGSQMHFRSLETLDNSGNPRYVMENAQGVFQIWDITNPISPLAVQSEDLGGG
ncbi:MAG: hypothetical protein AAF193_08340, partial [Bacteroidota bacterium]